MSRCFLVLFAVALIGAAEAPPGPLPLVFADDFSKGMGRWQPTDPKGWKVIDTKDGKALSQFHRESSYKPPHRSPYHIALVKDVTVGDFVFEARCRSTVKDYPHRDLCLFFGYRDAGHFYYAHLGKKTDDHANQIFIVNGADRKKISTRTTAGTNWDDGWHRVKVVRSVADGKIEVYFDDMKKPVMTAKDKTFTAGRVGVGSFDDTGDWADVKLRGRRLRRPAVHVPALGPVPR